MSERGGPQQGRRRKGGNMRDIQHEGEESRCESKEYS